MVLLWLYSVSIYIPSPLVLLLVEVVIMTSLQHCICHYSLGTHHVTAGRSRQTREYLLYR